MTRIVRNRIEGVADPLPPGENILWSGKPDVWKFTFRTMRLWWVMAWFFGLACLRAYHALMGGGDLIAMISAAAGQLPLAVFSIGLLSGLGVVMARTTTYVISRQRLVFQVGVALPITFNVPLRFIDSAAVRLRQSHYGDLVLTLRSGSCVKALALWPHCQGWGKDSVKPVMRDLSTVAIEELKPILAQVLLASQQSDESQTNDPLGQVSHSSSAQSFYANEEIPA
jgi:Bacterial PH domain